MSHPRVLNFKVCTPVIKVVFEVIRPGIYSFGQANCIFQEALPGIFIKIVYILYSKLRKSLVQGEIVDATQMRILEDMREVDEDPGHIIDNPMTMDGKIAIEVIAHEILVDGIRAKSIKSFCWLDMLD